MAWDVDSKGLQVVDLTTAITVQELSTCTEGQVRLCRHRSQRRCSLSSLSVACVCFQSHVRKGCQLIDVVKYSLGMCVMLHGQQYSSFTASMPVPALSLPFCDGH